MINPERYAEGFNQGFQAGAQKFETFIVLLGIVYGLKIVLLLPPVNSRIKKHVSVVEDPVNSGLDVLGFFIVLVFVWAWTGQLIIQ